MEKNSLFIETIRRDNEMEDVLMEIVKNRVNEKVNTAVNETTVKHINDILAKLKYIAEQAMELLSIPQSQRSTYAGLVGKRTPLSIPSNCDR
jgi:hypothetical protein